MSINEENDDFFDAESDDDTTPVLENVTLL